MGGAREQDSWIKTESDYRVWVRRKGSLNTVLGSFDCQHYRAKHYFVHILQVFSWIQNIFIFIEWGTFCHSICDRFCQWQTLSHLFIPSSSIIIPSASSQKFAIGFTLHNQSRFPWSCLKILLTPYTRREKLRCKNQTWKSFFIQGVADKLGLSSWPYKATVMRRNILKIWHNIISTIVFYVILQF